MPRAAFSAAPLELLVEYSENDVGTGVQKTCKLIDRDQVDFIIGDVNSGIAQAIAQVTSRRRFSTSSRAATPTRSPARIASGTSIASAIPRGWRQRGRRPALQQVRQELALHYARTMPTATPQEACAANSEAGGTVTGNELTPLGTGGFLRQPDQGARGQTGCAGGAAAGCRMVNCLKQVAQFGINRHIPLPGPSRSSNRSRQCRRKRASASGCSNGTGSRL